MGLQQSATEGRKYRGRLRHCSLWYFMWFVDNKNIEHCQPYWVKYKKPFTPTCKLKNKSYWSYFLWNILKSIEDLHRWLRVASFGWRSNINGHDDKQSETYIHVKIQSRVAYFCRLPVPDAAFLWAVVFRHHIYYIQTNIWQDVGQLLHAGCLNDSDCINQDSADVYFLCKSAVVSLRTVQK